MSPMFVGMSWGAGVQSTALSLIHKHDPWLYNKAGIPPPEAYVFSDPGAESPETINHIEQLVASDHFKSPFYRVSGGDILSDDGKRSLPPFFVLDESGNRSMVTRKCTWDLKVVPCERKFKQLFREKTGWAKRSYEPESIWIYTGISMDEVDRMKPGNHPFKRVYPLIEFGWDRMMCLDYCKQHLGRTVPRSSCFMCPFKRNWRTIRDGYPEEYARAVDYDSSLRDGRRSKAGITGTRFIHRFCLPLDEAVEQEIKKDYSSQGGVWLFDDFSEECEGHCGI